MATAPQKATLAVHCAPAAAGGSAAVVRRENASASGAVDWSVTPAAEDLHQSGSLIRADSSSKATTKGLHFSFSKFYDFAFTHMSST